MSADDRQDQGDEAVAHAVFGPDGGVGEARESGEVRGSEIMKKVKISSEPLWS